MLTPIQGQKAEVKMEIRVKSLKFDADQKLLDYVEKKVSKLSRFSDHLDDVEVTLSLLKEPDDMSVIVGTLMNIPWIKLIISFLIYFILGYLMYASMLAYVRSLTADGKPIEYQNQHWITILGEGDNK